MTSTFFSMEPEYRTGSMLPESPVRPAASLRYSGSVTTDAEALSRVSKTVELVRAQLSREYEEQERRRTAAAEDHKRVIAAEVDAHVHAQRSTRRQTVLLIVTCVPLLGSAFAWSYSTIAAEHRQRIDEEKRLQRIDIEVKSATAIGQKTAENLDAHERDFDVFRAEQRSLSEAGRLDRQRQSLMLERTLRSLGRRPPQKTPEHRAAREAAGWTKPPTNP